MLSDENAATSKTHPQRFDVVGVGESMLTLYPNNSDTVAFAWDIGGAESNVVRSLAALGFRSSWVSRLGTDLAGTLVHNVISASGTDPSMVEFVADLPTGLMLKQSKETEHRVQYYRTGSAASTMNAESIPLKHCLNGRILHLSGITLGLSKGCCDLVLKLLQEPGTALRSFDINWRPALWPSAPPSELFAEVANHAAIVFVGVDEADALWGVSDPAQIFSVLNQPERVIIKDDAQGSYALVGDDLTFESALCGTVVDPMGAGDAFAAGYLAGLLKAEADERHCLRLGHIVAMSAIDSEHDVGTPLPWTVINHILEASDNEWRSIRYDNLVDSIA